MEPQTSLKNWGIAVLGVMLLVLAGAGILVLFAIWPLVVPPAAGAPVVNSWGLFGQGPWTMSSDTALLLLVVVASALGSLVHAATSFATYVGNRRMFPSWIWWYILRTAIGASLALILYFAIRGGLFTGTAATADVNPYGIAAFAGITGLFSKQATDKLEEVFTTVLSTQKGSGDDQRADKPESHALVLESIDPPEVTKGNQDVNVEIKGEGFVPSSIAQALRADGKGKAARLTTTFQSPTSIAVVVPAGLINEPGNVMLSVINPEPGGGESEGIVFRVTP